MGSKLLVLLLRVLAKLPLRMLYGISNVLYFLMFHVVGYRRTVVSNNLKKSFPDYNANQIAEIERNFYKYLCDLIVETIKVPGMSSDEIQMRCVGYQPEVVDQYLESGRSVMLVLGHHGNYEWANLSYTSIRNHPFYVLFHPLKNKVLNQYFLETRAKNGTYLLAMKKAYRTLKNVGDKAVVMGFVADQSPSPQTAYWTQFLNQDTGFFRGFESVARDYNMPVVYVSIRRVKRGYYEMRPFLLEESPAHLPEGELLERYIRKLEEEITIQPETWFWSHRRWKHKKPVK